MKNRIPLLAAMTLLALLATTTACRKKYLQRPPEVYIPATQKENRAESTDVRGHYVVDEPLPAEPKSPPALDTRREY